jgi:predicted NBD/HSP70 family sugar kinase
VRLGVDLGGTKIAAAVLDPERRTIWEARVATPRDDYDGTLDAIAALIEAGERATASRCPVGIGMPGAISPATGGVKNANSTWLNGRPFKSDLERRLQRPVRCENDANCLALSESLDGAAAGAECVFAVILGTGVGGGLAIRGQIVTGANAIAGEWGHNPLPWPADTERPGPPCYCGRRGCIETFLSGPGLAADAARLSGVARPGEDVSAAADAGDLTATAALDNWTDRLARALATIVNTIDPHVIVVGGGLSRIARLYDDVPRLWKPWVFSDTVVTRIVPAKFGDASGVRGAALLGSFEP